jgi:activator of HSP90 ATPase
MSTPIHQEVVLPAAAERVYGALTEQKEFSALCGGAPTEIDPREGGTFSLFGGMILGRTVELVPGKRVVQAWRVKSWDPGVYSMVKFELEGDGKKTKVTLDHDGFPDGAREHLEKGWHTNYWDALKKHLG